VVGGRAPCSSPSFQAPDSELFSCPGIFWRTCFTTSALTRWRLLESLSHSAFLPNSLAYNVYSILETE
jgi:hypothetical protein